MPRSGCSALHGVNTNLKKKISRVNEWIFSLLLLPSFLPYLPSHLYVGKLITHLWMAFGVCFFTLLYRIRGNLLEYFIIRSL